VRWGLKLITRAVKSTACRYLASLATAFLLQAAISSAQDDNPRAPVSVRFDYGSNQTAKPSKSPVGFGRVGIDPNQTVGVTLQYPAAMAGQEIVAEAIDGGRLNYHGKNLAIDSKGQLSFEFTARDVPGDARITLYDGDTISLLQLWVRDVNHPERSPKSGSGN
jgi:hypothetical protein